MFALGESMFSGRFRMSQITMGSIDVDAETLACYGGRSRAQVHRLARAMNGGHISSRGQEIE